MPTSSVATADSPKSICCASASTSAWCRPATASAAPSQDGKLVAVANYQPGGVKVFSSDTLDLLADIPAEYGEGRRAKVVGLEDAANGRFAFSLFEAGEIWIADMADPGNPRITKFKGIGKEPYDALVTPGERYYIAGLFGEEGLALVDLWHLERGAPDPERVRPR